MNLQVNAKVRFKNKTKELLSLEEEAGMNDEYTDSAAGFDGSSNTSGSLYAEKPDTSSTHEIDSIKSTVSGDLAGLSLGQSPQPERVDPSDHRFSAQGTNDWVHGWGSDYSADNDLAVTYEENSRLRGSLEVAEASILELKLELSSLQSHADEIGTETQKVAEQLAAEIASGEQLAKEVSTLKLECSYLKDDLKLLNSSKLCASFTSIEATETKQDKISQDLQRRWLKEVLVLEDKVRELQNKSSVGYHEKDFRFLYSDLEALLSALQNLKEGTQLASPNFNLMSSAGASMKENRETSLGRIEQLPSEIGFDVDLCQPEFGMLHGLNVPGSESQDPDRLEVINAMKGKVFELLRELDDSKSEKEGLTKKMDQMECYYEALIQELEENQRQMLCELQNLRNEHSTCLYTVSSTKAEMETMCQGLNEQMLRLAEEKHDLDSINKELERKAIVAEAALKRARLNYSIAVNQLQKDLELLSVQVLSMFETNENLIRQDFVGSSPTSLPHFPEIAQEPKIDSLEFHSLKNLQCQNQYVGLKKHSLEGDSLLENLQKSLSIQEGLYRKVEEEVCEMYLLNIYLDVLSKTLAETLLEASDDARLMKEKIVELAQQLELSAESKELLMKRLKTAMDEVHSLNEYNAACIAEYKDVALKNQNLEANIQSSCCENLHLVQKITELESMIKECRSYENQFKACAAEKTQLEILFNEKTLENGRLQNEILTLRNDFIDVKSEFDEIASVKDNMQHCLNVLRSKLLNLLASHEKKFGGLPLLSESVSQSLESGDLTGFVMELGELQHNMCEKIAQLMEEEKILAEEKDMVQVSLTRAQSEIVVMKHRFELDMQEVLYKFSVSNASVRKLQLDVEAIANRLKNGSEVEENYAQLHKELIGNVHWLEVELQQLISKNKDLADEILALEIVTNELERSKVTTVELAKEKQLLTESLQAKTEESAKLVSELDDLKESLLSVHDENQTLMTSLQAKNEESVNLASELNSLKESQQFLHYENQAGTASLRDKTAECAKLEAEANNLRESMQSLLDESKASLASLQNRTEESVELVSELNGLRESLGSLHDENEALLLSLQHKTEESAELESELSGLKESFQSLHDELQEERSSRDKLEGIIADLTYKLDEKHCQVIHLNQQNLELAHLKQLLSDLESEKSRVCHLLLQYEECLKNARDESSSIVALETQLSELYETLVATDVKYIATRAQHEDWVEEVVEKLDSHLGGLCNRHKVVALCNEENPRLLTILDSLMSEFRGSIAENKLILDRIYSMSAEVEAYKNREVSWCDEKINLDSELQGLKNLVMHSEEEVDNLLLCNEELEVKDLLLKAKMEEWHLQITLLDVQGDELLKLENQCNDLTQKLSEQILKTEEFKNLSIHMKQLKDKAEADCSLAREKKETERQAVLVQDSLRVAFIKEQYETKLQELKHQLSISKKHNEEMLCKLQDSVVEIENRKRSEALHLKKNEELGMKILELEAELQSVISDKREKMKAFDMMTAELECSLISLECCKEEKQKLEASLEECNEEKSRTAIELTLMKELLKNPSSNSEEEGNDGSHVKGHISSQDLFVKVHENGPAEVLNAKYLEQDSSMKCEEPESVFVVPVVVDDHSSTIMDAQPKQDVPEASGEYGSLVHVNQESLLHGDVKHLALCDVHSRAESIKSSMDHLNMELERMKNDNLFLQNDAHLDSKFPGLQRELMQLQKANEELGSMFPLYNQYSSCGNALERVLALEIELAESLQAKKRSSMHLQSSFLKQHNDEEAVLQSFRDINNLIKDMLELKGSHASVETELKEMHDRYSQLSLQFAEVEGERQKLMMTLKNVRATRKAQQLNRSPSSSKEHST
ncbi:interaptin-like isoform X2 [Tripterygium wilfordii]|uniref:interaptin-like isoform X2 n=1 Tax=Tripterygium wilfordii TaxID=458696 RepID=UPI0018F81726|nr:interaptin-like isoform X2 [Tripterygium wilfordii]